MESVFVEHRPRGTSTVNNFLRLFVPPIVSVNVEIVKFLLQIVILNIVKGMCTDKYVCNDMIYY